MKILVYSSLVFVGYLFGALIGMFCSYGIGAIWYMVFGTIDQDLFGWCLTLACTIFGAIGSFVVLNNFKKEK